MNQVYYKMSYGEYKTHTHILRDCIAHSMDEVLSDDSEMLVKVNGEDHVHLYMERQPNVHPVSSLSLSDPELDSRHPLLKMRGR